MLPSALAHLYKILPNFIKSILKKQKMAQETKTTIETKTAVGTISPGYCFANSLSIGSRCK